jgi:hypothetical protein
MFILPLYFASLNYNKISVNLAVGYGQSDQRKVVCCPAKAKIYSYKMGCETPKTFYSVESVASSTEVQGPEHDDALSFIEEAKNIQRMYECLLPHAYAYQWSL